jgi:2-polyprenyl-3-methyl-5-hydroxy-6-metoxy-1,4-benzoquinol methylase
MNLEYYDRANPDLLKLLPADAEIIVEIGCGTGALGQQYRQVNPHGRYFGVDSYSEAVQIAAQRLDGAIAANGETVALSQLGLQPESVDCLVYGDVLEHMVDPWQALRKHIQWLKPGGEVLACIPNIQHWSAILNLLRGKWEYQERGLCDRTHLRFFTLDSIKNLFSQAGLQIDEIRPRGSQNEQFQKFQQIVKPILEQLQISPSQFATQTYALQYIIRAVKAQTPPPRVLIQTVIGTPQVCDHARVLLPDRFLGTIPGVRTVSGEQATTINVAKPQEEKIFIWQRRILEYPKSLQSLKTLLQAGYLIVAEIDDDPLRRPEYAANHFLSYRGCHCVQTSTEPLAEYLRQHNPNVAVFSNQIAFLPPPRTYEEQPVTLFFGAVNRERDAEPIMDTLNRILTEYGEQVQVKVIHDRQFFERLETPYKEFTPFCSYDRYQAILRTCDIGLLPLAPTRMNSMKSDLKFLEHAAHGVLAIASPTVYQQSIVEGKTGLLYNSPAELETKLRQAIDHPTWRRQIATNAYEWVKQNRLLCQHYRQRYNWYQQMRADLPRLNRELYSRVPELFEK